MSLTSGTPHTQGKRTRSPDDTHRGKKKLMAVRRHKSHGKWVLEARVAYQGLRKSVYCATKEEAKKAEARLLQELTVASDECVWVNHRAQGGSPALSLNGREVLAVLTHLG